MEYEIRLLPEFEEWLDGLKDKLAQEAVAERLIRASRGISEIIRRSMTG